MEYNKKIQNTVLTTMLIALPVMDIVALKNHEHIYHLPHHDLVREYINISTVTDSGASASVTSSLTATSPTRLTSL